MEMSEGSNVVLKEEVPTSRSMLVTETSEGSKDVLKQDTSTPSFVTELETAKEHGDVMMRDLRTCDLEEVETCEELVEVPRGRSQNMTESRNGEEAEATGSAQERKLKAPVVQMKQAEFQWSRMSNIHQAHQNLLPMEIPQPVPTVEGLRHQYSKNNLHKVLENKGMQQQIGFSLWLILRSRGPPFQLLLRKWVPDTVSEGERKGSKPNRISVVDQLMNVDEQLLYGPFYNPQALQGYILLCCQVLDGGLRDKPGKSPDYYHTYYYLSGLTLAQDCASHRINAPPPPLAVLGPYNNLLEPVHPLCNIDLNRYYEAKGYFKQQNL